MPYPKRRNLLLGSWTEEDKERFISRDLMMIRGMPPDTWRSTCGSISIFPLEEERHKGGEADSGAQRQGDGILRHMWGLNKDREANHLHHAVDALVVACATDGHVYPVSNLSKEVERRERTGTGHSGGQVQAVGSGA